MILLKAYGDKKMIINYQKKTIQIKMVYFGPAMSGKTTTLKTLMAAFGQESEMQSIETSTGRTLVFDFGTLMITGKEWNIKILLLTATGQDFYSITRPATIEMVDGIIFVVDSQRKYIEENKRSWQELFLYFGQRLYDLPLVVALNKQDLPETISEEEFRADFNVKSFKSYKILKTVAKDRESGVLNSFKYLLKFIFPTIQVSSEVT